MQNAQITGTLNNARFLEIGGGRIVAGGVTEGFQNLPDGLTFYTDPIDELNEEDVVRCGERHYSIKRNF